MILLKTQVNILDQIMDNIKSMSELAKANNIEMILCSLVPANSFPWRPEIIPTKKSSN